METRNLFGGHFEGHRIDGFAQVLYCAVNLHQGIVVPFQFIGQAMKTSQQALIPLETNELIQSIMSDGSILLAKSTLGKFFYLWKYIPNTCKNFLGGIEFNFQVEADALIVGAVVGFDADLKSNKLFRVLRRKLVLLWSPRLSIKVCTFRRIRIAAKKILAADGNRTYLLADKEDGKNRSPTCLWKSIRALSNWVALVKV